MFCLRGYIHVWWESEVRFPWKGCSTKMSPPCSSLPFVISTLLQQSVEESSNQREKQSRFRTQTRLNTTQGMGSRSGTELCFYKIIIINLFGQNFVFFLVQILYWLSSFIFKFIRQCWCSIDRSNHILLLFYHVMILF